MYTNVERIQGLKHLTYDNNYSTQSCVTAPWSLYKTVWIYS